MNQILEVQVIPRRRVFIFNRKARKERQVLKVTGKRFAYRKS